MIDPSSPTPSVEALLHAYLPAKFRIRFLEPIEFERDGMYEDKSLVQTIAHEIRARIQDNVLDMIKQRKSVWFG